MKHNSNLLSSKCVCPLCWIVAAVAFLGVVLLMFHPNSPSGQIADWLKYYVLIGTLMTAAWMGANAPAILRNASEVGTKEPVVLLLGVLLFGGAPVILFPIMVSAWPILGLCALCHRRQRHP